MPKKRASPSRRRTATTASASSALVAPTTASNASANATSGEPEAFAALRYSTLTNGSKTLQVVELPLLFPPGDWKALEEAAMEWTYVLRSRQRWVSSASASEQHVDRATADLQSFGLSPGVIQNLARAAHVEVRMAASAHHDGGWSTRVLPWEYVIAGATRPYRHGEPLTITRSLDIERSIELPPDRIARPVSRIGLRVLYVESAPSEIAKYYDFRGERELIDVYLMQKDSGQVCRLYSPTLDELRDAVGMHRPHIVHLAGVDNHEGALRLRSQVSEDLSRGGAATRKPSAPEAKSEVWQRDGYLLSSAQGAPDPVTAEALAEALTGGRTWYPWLVCMNLENSASRVAPRAVQAGCHAAIGFQDTFDEALAERFFGSLYAALGGRGTSVAGAFRKAWESVRSRPGSLLGTGVVLWTDSPEIDVRRMAAHRRPPSPQPKSEKQWLAPNEVDLEWFRSRVRVSVKPKTAINYSLLHNDGELFEEFSIRPNPDTRARGVEVRVTLCAGAENANYACSIDLSGEPIDLSRDIKVSLGANLIRSVHEAILTTLLVEIVWGHHVLLRETYPVRLLPIDQWRDAEHGRSWLPSFVFPRDQAVCELVAKAGNYVRVLRDDPAAGFEGYQCLPDKPAPRDAADVDLQVQAIWSTILYEWRLTYVNPPPAYSNELDSQRLRTPSTIARDRHGTCIDLALLLASCLELVDIWPVIFLLDDHAFPGYWRADSFQERFRSARPEEGTMREIMDASAESNSVGGSQVYPWAVGRVMHKEILREIRAGRLVPIETVRLTENCGFFEAIEAGKENFEDPDKFEFLIDIAIARQHGITPLPLIGETA